MFHGINFCYICITNITIDMVHVSMYMWVHVPTCMYAYVYMYVVTKSRSTGICIYVCICIQLHTQFQLSCVLHTSSKVKPTYPISKISIYA